MAKVINENIVRDFVKALKAERKKPSAYDTTAKVLRVDGDTAWVHIAGGVDETPVKLTVNAEKGDEVQVRVSGGKAWIVGNATAPPTDDKTANIAHKRAVNADTKAIAAKQTAEEADGKATDAKEKADEAIEAVGASITTDTLHYLATSLDSGVTINTPGWTTTIQSMTSTNRYLWTYHTYHKASGQSVNTNPVITGAQGPTGPAGSDGEDGVSVTMVQPYYCLSASDSQLAGTETWGTAIPTPTSALPYIWTKDLVTFSNNTSSYSTAVYNEALTYAVSTAEEALTIAEGIDEHFWYDNTGAHITQVSQEDWNDPNSQYYHAKGNTLITSEGMAVRDGMSELATFGAYGTRIGTTDASRAEISDDEFNLITDEGVTAFSVTTGTATKETWVADQIDTSSHTAVLNESTPYVLDKLEEFASGDSFRFNMNIRKATNTDRSSRLCTFIVGTPDTYTMSNSQIGTISIAYDGIKTVTVTVTNIIFAFNFWCSYFGHKETVHMADVNIDGNENIDGSLAVSKDVSVDRDVTVTRTLTIGDPTVGSAATGLAVYRNAIFNKPITANKKITLKNTAINNIDFGSATLNETAGSSYGNTTINFNTTFDSPPIVVVSLVETINNANVGQTQIGVYSVTTSDFTVRFHNASNYARAFTINWIAIL